MVPPSAPAALPADSTGRAEAAEEHVEQRTVHRLAHRQGQDGSRCADERAADDEHVVAQHESGARCGESRERVEQRDDHRHVGAADRHDEEHAEDERQHDEHEEQREVLIADDRGRHRARGSRAGCRPLTALCRRYVERTPGHQLLQLRERDEAAREAQ